MSPYITPPSKGVSGANGWEVTPPASPVEEAWPGVVVDERCGTWLSTLEVVPTRADGWPSLEGGVEVTVEVCSNIEEL
jgi:hypothetical protein